MTSPLPVQRAKHLAGLMERVVTGDQGAFAQLYDSTSPLVHGTAVRVLRDPDLAAEVTQEVMLEVWRSAPGFDPARGHLLAWMATMAHRRAVDRVRAVRAQRDRDERAGQRELHTPYDAVAQTVEDDDERRRVRGCLDALTDLQRDAVERAYYGGRNYREVAEDLEAPLPKIKSRIKDGLIRLRDCLGVDR